MTRWTLRLGLSLFLAVGCWANPLSAQTVQPVAGVVVGSPNPPPHAAFDPALAGTPDQANVGAAQPRGPIRGFFNRHGVCCQNNRLGACSNLAAELRFIFGSCRAFYNEPCVPIQRRPQGPGQ